MNLKQYKKFRSIITNIENLCEEMDLHIKERGDVLLISTNLDFEDIHIVSSSSQMSEILSDLQLFLRGYEYRRINEQF